MPSVTKQKLGIELYNLIINLKSELDKISKDLEIIKNRYLDLNRVYKEK